MQELINALVAQLGVDERQARGGTGVLFRAAREKLGAGEFDRTLGGLAGVNELMGQAPASGGAGRLLGGLAGAFGGGNTAILADVVGAFGKLGLSQEHAKRFVPIVLGFLRERLGAGQVDQIERALRS